MRGSRGIEVIAAQFMNSEHLDALRDGLWALGFRPSLPEPGPGGQLAPSVEDFGVAFWLIVHPPSGV